MEDVREGGDITAADMVPPTEDPSQIAAFYRGSNVFITGATGFIGKMFLEKLLRSCSDVNAIYVLIRKKKNKDIQKRFEELFDGPNFDPLKRHYPNFTEKVILIPGDCSQPNLGLHDDDYTKLIARIDCIFHCAATVRFDEPLKTAVHINVRSLRDLLDMAKQMKQLRAMIYVSTAFANCLQKTIDEVFYPPPIDHNRLLTLLECLEDEKIEAITPVVLDRYPNTYVFTKVIAESVIQSEAKQLPVVVFRPAIVIASVKEPVAGWIDNWYGATGVLVGAALGVLRSLHGRKENTSELVPADYVVNCALAAAWDIATIKSLNNNKETKERTKQEEQYENQNPVYNYVSSPQKTLNWEDFTRLAEKHAKQVPTELMLWHYFFAIRSNRIAHMLAVFFYHKVPAYLCDWICILIGKEPMLVKGYQKIDKFGKVLEYFSMRNWKFTNGNVLTLWTRMNRQDRQMFEFSMENFNWDMYFYTYVRGARAYLLKDPLDTIPAGTVKYYKLMAAHYALVALVFFSLYKLFIVVVTWLFAF